MKKIILIIVGIIVIIGCLFLGIYLFDLDVYIKLKYGDNIGIEEKTVSDNLSNLEVSLNVDNYIRSTEIYDSFIISKSGIGNSDRIKNGFANLKYYIDGNGNVIILILDILDVNRESYLDEILDKEIEIKILNETAKYITSDDNYLYILTNQGNVYVGRLNNLTDTFSFEEELINLSKGNFYTYLDSANVIELVNYYGSDENYNDGRIYALRDDDGLVNVLSGRGFDDEERYSSSLRFGNARIVINRDGSIQYCSSWNDVSNCYGDNLGDEIVDGDGNKIEVYSLIEHDSYLYVIDTDGNIYREEYDNGNHLVIEKIDKYNSKKVESLVYIYDYKEPYMLEELVINYSNGTRNCLKTVSRLDIYTIN